MKMNKKYKSNNTDNFDFSTLVKPYLSDEDCDKFRQSLNDEPISSFIVNTTINHDFNFDDRMIVQDKDDKLLYRFNKDEERLGKSLFHFAGAFYILDPSSATISYYLKDYLPDNFVSLDLCGAPGGKSIALSMRRNDGLYLCNDISFTRANEITKNADRLGLNNLYSLSIDPERINLGPIFDCLILDVPCSGSGMIRKEPKMKEDWSIEKVQRLLPIQANLLEKAYSLLKAGGILAYSTCSLSLEEDEEQIAMFLKAHPDMSEIKVKTRDGMREGKFGYHMVPGIFDGEGIYFCLLRKEGTSNFKFTQTKTKDSNFTFGKNKYKTPIMYDEIAKLNFLSPGRKINDSSEHPKCEFDHAYSKVCDSYPIIEVSKEQGIEYAKGNEIKCDSNVKDGLVILSYEGCRLGFGKKVGNKIKNYLPKGLRENLIA